jgi:hypothetical protein
MLTRTYLRSSADVYDRMTIFEDHLVRDINAGRFSKNTSLVLVTHGLALRIFLMRWFHWTVDQVRCDSRWLRCHISRVLACCRELPVREWRMQSLTCRRCPSTAYQVVNLLMVLCPSAVSGGVQSAKCGGVSHVPLMLMGPTASC